MKDRFLKYLPWTILALGAVLRVAQFLYNRSVTEGEAALALNIINRSYAGLLRPLDLVQAAPYGFLIIQKFMLSIFGSNDYSLRIFPQLCGLISLLIFWAASKKILSGACFMIGLLLFSVSEYLIYFASELKQYSTDVTVGLIITSLTVSVLTVGFNRRNFAGLALCTGLGIWLSHPAFFFLCGCGLVIMFHIIKNQLKDTWPFWIALILIFLASFTANYVISLKNLAGSRDFLNFWQPAFMPLPPRSMADLRWFGYAFIRTFKNPAGFPVPLVPLAMIFFTLGIVRLYKKKTREAWLVVLPAILCLVVSGLHKYPFEGRLLLFVVPVMVILIAAGVEFLRGDASRGRRIAGTIAVLLLILPVTGIAAYRLIRPRQPEELRPVMRYLQAQYRSGDAIYVYYAAVNGFNYYSWQMAFHPDGFYSGIESRADPAGYLRDLKRMTGRPRVWVIMSHIATWSGVDEEKVFVDDLNQLGTPVSVYRVSGASAYLYDLAH
jgi:hypothetical protein